MGYRFNHQIKVALDPNKLPKTRRWAIWRCSSSIAKLTINISTVEVYFLVSQNIGFCGNKKPPIDKLPTNKEIVRAISLLIQIRFRVIHILHLYESKRWKQKLRGRRFPVPVAFKKEDVIFIISSSSSTIESHYEKI